ncbi:MAG: hypothetical protein KME64_17485 [Scytonematopsis contorta HA4267-MV1]|jgi:hypothetical protein|nr:hypothetical protein [Scytonematopsis contorta HA4267-MV1]
MIHHISISAQNPQHVATVLAEVVKGQVAPFPPHPGSYIVVAFDEHGTAIEILPLGCELLPGTELDSVHFVHNPHPSRFTATHAAISVSTSQAEIEQIGSREQWRVVRCNRDSLFDVMEFWVENSLMIEFLTPEMARQYLAFTQQHDAVESFLAQSAGTIS